MTRVSARAFGDPTARGGRIPRPIRWPAALGLLPVPGPFDEAVLLLVGVVLLAFYRRPLREAWTQADLDFPEQEAALAPPPVSFPRAIADGSRHFILKRALKRPA